MKSSRLKKSLTPSQQCLDRSSSTWSNGLDGQLKMPLKSLLSILTTPKMPSTTSMRNTQGSHSHRTTPTSGLRLTGVRHVKEESNVTVLAQLHIWHKSHTLPGSPICTVCLFAPLYPLPIRTSPAPPASSLLLFFFSLFLPCLSSRTSIQVSSLKPSQVKVTESVRLEFCSAIASSQQLELLLRETSSSKEIRAPRIREIV